MKKRIVVTEDDIDKGERSSYCDCPVARAVKRAFRLRSDREITVRHEGIFVGSVRDNRLWVAQLPAELEKFISAFDSGKRVKPLETLVEFR